MSTVTVQNGSVIEGLRNGEKAYVIARKLVR